MGAVTRGNNAWRILTVGGMTSFLALFNWLNPYIYVPSLVVAPVMQILLFAFIGRSAGVGDDRFYLIGNAVQYAAIPCLFAMSHTIGGERRSQTLSLILASPAPRIALFLGRSIPVVANGWFVCVVALAVGAGLLGVSLPGTAWAGLAVTCAVAAASCTGLGLVTGSLALVVRSSAVFDNVIFGLLLICAGANVPLSALPTWMAALGRWLPMSHAIEASREVAAGATLAQVAPLLAREIGVGALCAALGLVLLRVLETRSRRAATLEIQ